MAETAGTLSKEVFRDVIGRFASGVTILSTRSGDQDFGTTASALSSLSLEPPMLLACLNETSTTRSAIAATGSFAVNILGEEQASLAARFATKSDTKFETLEVDRSPAGAPLLQGCLAHLECQVVESVTGGTHTVFLGLVTHAEGRDGLPLTYFRGRFGRFEDELQESAYRIVRGLVLDRAVPQSGLSPETLADEFGLEPARVNYALTTLLADGLVTRHAAGGFSIVRFDTRAVEDALGARCAIEVAAADAVVPTISDASVAVLRTYAEAACRAAAADPPDVSGLATASAAFHQTFISLLENERLTEAHQRLRISTVWLKTLGPGEYVDPSYLTRLVAACEARDASEAKRIIYEHRVYVSGIARAAVERAGGLL